jgi:Protein of unknown function (DUF2815)
MVAADKICLRDGDKKDYDGYAEHFYLKATNDVKPLVLDQRRSPLGPDDGRPYSGCFVNGTLTLWIPSDKACKAFGRQVRANLRGVQFAADGEAFGGGQPGSVEEFESTGDDKVAVGSANDFL